VPLQLLCRRNCIVASRGEWVIACASREAAAPMLPVRGGLLVPSQRGGAAARQPQVIGLRQEWGAGQVVGRGCHRTAATGWRTQDADAPDGAVGRIAAEGVLADQVRSKGDV
jgi:hypothetical protein